MEKAESKLELINKLFGPLNHKQLGQLAALEDLYNEWNSRINIISRKDIDKLYRNHVLHSLSIALVFSFGKGHQVVDIGTGGGFPGIPLAILFPSTQFHLVDSIAKKIKVVEVIVGSIGLVNITAEHARVEDIRNRKFDSAVSRAVAPLAELWRWTKPLLKKSGKEGFSDDAQYTEQISKRIEAHGLICLKGGSLDQEIAESKTRPTVYSIRDYIDDEYFQLKKIIYVSRGQAQG
jgi:16S rRNA (guanine527-N7)-methyltransferase